MTGRFEPTDQERAILNALRKAWPAEAAYPLGSPADRDFEAAATRLLAARVIQRNEIADAALYKLADEFVADFGGTTRPQDN